VSENPDVRQCWGKAGVAFGSLIAQGFIIQCVTTQVLKTTQQATPHPSKDLSLCGLLQHLFVELVSMRGISQILQARK